jgi:polyhydroxyalkanoate synthesis regulator phasin
MTAVQTPLTDEQLADIRTRFEHTTHPGWRADTDTGQLLAEVDRLRDRVAELEAHAHGCDGEGCMLPHSSWCERAKAYAAEHDGCTCGRPWENTPQPHSGHCWLLSPPRSELDEARAEVDRLRAELAAAQARIGAVLALPANEPDEFMDPGQYQYADGYSDAIHDARLAAMSAPTT